MKNFPELLGSEVISEDVKVKLQEAWDAKLNEARTEITATLREEFAQRYEHDKGLIIESMDQMISEAIMTELSELKHDRAELSTAKVAYATKVREHSETLNKFVMEMLAKEISEIRNDRNEHKSSVNQLEEFVLHRLSNELNELREDEIALRDARVRLVTEGKQIITTAKEKFVKESAQHVQTVIGKALKNEIHQLKEDIQIAKQNTFGRKIMEAFAAEYMSSHFADGTAVKKLSTQLSQTKSKLDESQKALAAKDTQIADAQRKTRIAEDANKRGAIMQELLSPLAKEKREIMEDLLTTVRTDNLKESFEKYLPAVLDKNVSVKTKTKLIESALPQKTVFTGDKIANGDVKEAKAEILSLKKLAGI
jgi:electron transfer flavoprotein alpha subunit